MPQQPDTKPLVIACGALVRELRAVFGQLGLAPESFDVRYLPARLHNRPDRIVPAIERILDEHVLDDESTDGDRSRAVIYGYGDCGTGGGLDRLIASRGGSRLAGAHCYEFLAGSALFARLNDEEIGTFYLTDFLARNFDTLILAGLGITKHPELRDLYFGNYRRLVLLRQDTTTDLTVEAGRAAASSLGLEFVCLPVGLSPFADSFGAALEQHGAAEQAEVANISVREAAVDVVSRSAANERGAVVP